MAVQLREQSRKRYVDAVCPAEANDIIGVSIGNSDLSGSGQRAPVRIMSPIRRFEASRNLDAL